MSRQAAKMFKFVEVLFRNGKRGVFDENIGAIYKKKLEKRNPLIKEVKEIEAASIYEAQKAIVENNPDMPRAEDSNLKKK